MLPYQCDQIWRFVTILAIFGGIWWQFFCPKSQVYKSFDVDILGFGKFIYVLWWQIWRFLPKCWLLFGLNTWSHWQLSKRTLININIYWKKENFAVPQASLVVEVFTFKDVILKARLFVNPKYNSSSAKCRQLNRF